jgi:hypothetical protein
VALLTVLDVLGTIFCLRCAKWPVMHCGCPTSDAEISHGFPGHEEVRWQSEPHTDAEDSGREVERAITAAQRARTEEAGLELPHGHVKSRLQQFVAFFDEMFCMALDDNAVIRSSI